MVNETYARVADAPATETYKEFMSRLDLYNKLAAGLRDVQEGRTSPVPEALARIRARIH